MRSLLLLVSLICGVAGIARFEPTSVTDTSLVIKMVKGGNVSRFDMIVHIFDLDRLVEYRKTELLASTKDQLFSFDGLTPSTWFAFRIHYRLVYQNATDYSDFATKQELIVRTKANDKGDPSKIDDRIAYIEEVFVNRDNIYISINSMFNDTKKVITVIVPELKCSKGVLKPLAQQVHPHARFHFDLTPLGEPSNQCSRICVFPFLRVAIHNRTSETFRGKEWCGSVQEAQLISSNSVSRIALVAIIILSALFL